jgi:hypothetical protein
MIRASILPTIAFVGMMAISFTYEAIASEVMVYPAKGQSVQAQQKDEYECFGWAKQRTGYDPTRPSYASAPPGSSPPPPQGQIARGTARGALIGAATGAIRDDDAGKGAAAGAAAGALIGAFRRRDQRRRHESQARQQQQYQSTQQNSQRDGYNRAFAACMEARGYVVR